MVTTFDSPWPEWIRGRLNEDPEAEEEHEEEDIEDEGEE